MFDQIQDHEYTTRPDVRFRLVFDEAVVLKQEDAEVLVVNEVGSRVLDRLQGGLRPSQIVAALAEEYDATPHALAQDVERFVAELLAAHVIVAARPAEPEI